MSGDKQDKEHMTPAEEGWPLHRILEMLAILEDRALEQGHEALALHLRRAQHHCKVPPPLDADEVLYRCGLDPNFHGKPIPESVRRALSREQLAEMKYRMRGNTTRMLAEAVALLDRHIDVEIVGHNRYFTTELVHRASVMAQEAGIDPRRVVEWRDRHLQPGVRFPHDLLELYDHYVRERSFRSMGVPRRVTER